MTARFPDGRRGTEPENLDTRLSEAEDRWMRTAADFENYRRRAGRDIERARNEERRKAAAELLPAVDALDQAVTHGGNSDRALIEGVEAARRQAISAIERLGFPRDDSPGVPFDPARHEVAAVVPDGTVPPETVIEVLRPGYGSPDNLLRPATVAVSKGRSA